jgi:ATF/CREB family transcription factor
MAFNNYKRKSPRYESDDPTDDSDFHDSDSDFDVASVATNSNKSQKLGSSETSKGRGSIMRKPTRIPNPKVSNRNALLARENRMRKKQYVGELEREIEAVKMENRKLRQMMKKKNGEISKLEIDRTYLKSILMNKTEIFSILKTIQNTRIPINNAGPISSHHPTTVNDYKRSSSLHGSRSSFSSASPSGDHHGNDESDPFISSTDIEPDSLFTDFGLDIGAMTPQSINGWDTLLGDCQPQHVYCTDGADKTANVKFNNINIESEHNYFESDQKTDAVVPKPGICLHITDSRVSLELCATCHQQAQQTSWIDEEEL